ncbi:MAG: UDP-N-acetylmuramate--L-alanine ligase [Eubacteriales bacterium]|nr:UDP-N-acetylmuramate--L-alanine ligase [Eubacteriales bacterium]
MVGLTEYKNIHFIGIGGIGISALAKIMKARGYEVSGSDMNASDMTRQLEDMGIRVFIGHNAENVNGADLVVYSAAIAPENPEMVRADERGVKKISRAEMLGTIMSEFKCGIAVSGTHGKTTTTSMVSLALQAAGYDPTILVGGNLDEIGGNVAIGHSDYFVTEACEYRDSFLQLRPDIEIILNIDSDHLDYFKDVEHIVKSFNQFASYVPDAGRIIAYDSNPFVNEVIKGRDNVVTYGYNLNSDFYISNVRFNEGMPQFDITTDGKTFKDIQLSIPGEHNILNAVAAFACCYGMGADPDVVIKTISAYTGIKRRFDEKGKFGDGVMLVDDYAHHPTEIKATLAAASKIPHNRIWCLFQPHTYTRTLALFDEFADAFANADELILADIYAAREKDIYEINSQKLCKAIQEEHPNKDVYYIPGFEDMADFVIDNAQKDDIVITMGAGDIYKVGDIIMKKAGQKD